MKLSRVETAQPILASKHTIRSGRISFSVAGFDIQTGFGGLGWLVKELLFSLIHWNRILTEYKVGLKTTFTSEELAEHLAIEERGQR